MKAKPTITLLVALAGWKEHGHSWNTLENDILRMLKLTAFNPLTFDSINRLKKIFTLVFMLKLFNFCLVKNGRNETSNL